MEKQKIDIDQIITVGGELISDSPPKTKVGRILRWIKKVIQIKKVLGIKIKPL